MSSHHSQKSINLHHSQADAGRVRRRARNEEMQLVRLVKYVHAKEEGRSNYNILLASCIGMFVYVHAVTAAYLYYMFKIFWA